jgi:hypothetical protein
VRHDAENQHAIAPSRSRSVRLCNKNARSVTSADLLLHPNIGTRTSDPAIRRMTTTPYPYLVFFEAADTEIIIPRRPPNAYSESSSESLVRLYCLCRGGGGRVSLGPVPGLAHGRTELGERGFHCDLHQQGRTPRVLVTDKLKSGAAAKRDIVPGVEPCRAACGP